MKMFIVTIIVFIIFLTITLLSQRFLFESMYYKKERDIKINVIKFSNTLTNHRIENEIIESIERFESNYNTSIAVQILKIIHYNF